MVELRGWRGLVVELEQIVAQLAGIKSDEVDFRAAPSRKFPSRVGPGPGSCSIEESQLAEGSVH